MELGVLKFVLFGVLEDLIIGLYEVSLGLRELAVDHDVAHFLEDIKGHS